MSSMVQFPELNDLLIETGLSISAISKGTKVARNTLSAMRDNREVSANSVRKLLKALKNEFGVDVRRYNLILQDRIDEQFVQQATVANGNTPV